MTRIFVFGPERARRAAEALAARLGGRVVGAAEGLRGDLVAGQLVEDPTLPTPPPPARADRLVAADPADAPRLAARLAEQRRWLEPAPGPGGGRLGAALAGADLIVIDPAADVAGVCVRRRRNARHRVALGVGLAVAEGEEFVVEPKPPSARRLVDAWARALGAAFALGPARAVVLNFPADAPSDAARAAEIAQLAFWLDGPRCAVVPILNALPDGADLVAAYAEAAAARVGRLAPAAADPAAAPERPEGLVGWFHAIDFRPALPFVSASRFEPGAPPNYTLFGVYDLLDALDLTGAECLDIGAMDGVAAFGLKARGASRVTATDIAARPTFRFARAALGLEIEYLTDFDLYSALDRLGGRRFDLALMAGVLYHVFDPLHALATLRQLTRAGGYAIVETHHLPGETEPVMRFNPADPKAIDTANFFWRPSLACLDAMAALCCFETVARVDIGRRVACLLRARRPSEMAALAPGVADIQRRHMAMRHYRESLDFARLEAADDAPPAIRLRTPPPARRRLAVKDWRGGAPFQPAPDRGAPDRGASRPTP